MAETVAFVDYMLNFAEVKLGWHVPRAIKRTSVCRTEVAQEPNRTA